MQNCRIISGGGDKTLGYNTAGGVGVVGVTGKQKKLVKPSVTPTTVKLTHAQLEKGGVITESNVPYDRRQNVYFNIISPTPGTFVITMHYKGRTRGLLELDLKLDDLLEMQQNCVEEVDLKYVKFSVSNILALLNRQFSRKR